MTPPDRPARRPNHLAGQTSPYLLQHLYNPVDWYAWGEEALARARREDKPIFLSIGYAACHWCHVMERESFEDERIAAYLNEHFVSIKVDREERPDIDEIYMNAVQVLTGQGGWPLSAFLAPDLEPFFAGTYFPPENRYGRPGFPEVLRQLHEAWTNRRDDVVRSANQLTEQLRRIASGGLGASDGAGEAPVGRTEAVRAVADLSGRFDDTWGGFGNAPKFPPEGALALLLREHAASGEAVPLQMVERTLAAMADGGLYDHVGGGFARYSVDREWLVPHFEKMLYNQALLVPVYVDAFLATGKLQYRRVATETLDFVRRELTDPGGGFHSSLDADSEGEEGRFYVWSPDEIDAVLGETDGAFFCDVYGITAEGNFEGRNIPNLLAEPLPAVAARLGTTEDELAARLAPLRAKLRSAREKRVRPGTDDKVLASWNGLMITAFARAYQALGREEDLAAARAAARFVLDRLADDGRLRASYREGTAQLNAYLDDHAFVGRALVDLYEADFDPAWLDEARGLARTIGEHFTDVTDGSFFFTSDDHETLLTRNKSLHDGALPAGAGVACELLLRLGLHLDDDGLRRATERALIAYRPAVARAPSAYASLLVAADYAAGPVHELAVVGPADDPRTAALLDAVRRRYLPRRALAWAPPGRAADRLALLRDKQPEDDRPTAWLCRDYACERPTSDPDALSRALTGH